MITRRVVVALLLFLAAIVFFVPALAAGQGARPAARQALPRTVMGKPDFSGIWQVRNTAAVDLLDHVAKFNMPAGKGVVAGDEIPYQPAAAAKRIENFKNRATEDPFGKCYLPGVPRIMYLDFPFQIFQTPQMIAMTFEWSSVHRQIYTDGSAHVDDIDFWMGDSRGKWEGDTLVVEVTNHNDRTWFDMAGNFHSEALKLTERYKLLDADTIEYEVTFDDPKTFTRPWKISMPIHRHKGRDRILEYQCQAEAEEANGAFPREPATWYPEPGAPPSPVAASSLAPFSSQQAVRPRPAVKAAGIKRLADGKPDLQGFYGTDSFGINFGLGPHAPQFGLPGGKGWILDPADQKLPYQDWARAEQQSRALAERGYDDPAAHCFVYGMPRSMYTGPFRILQPPGYVVILFERMSHRIIAMERRAPLPDHLRLWQGDSVGRWDGDTLIVETKNLNGKSWLNEIGEVITHAQTVVERFTPIDATNIEYEATVSDPIAYTKPWTIGFKLIRGDGETLEVACKEDDQDLPHLKAVKDAAAGKK